MDLRAFCIQGTDAVQVLHTPCSFWHGDNSKPQSLSELCAEVLLNKPMFVIVSLKLRVLTIQLPWPAVVVQNWPEATPPYMNIYFLYPIDKLYEACLASS